MDFIYTQIQAVILQNDQGELVAGLGAGDIGTPTQPASTWDRLDPVIGVI